MLLWYYERKQCTHNPKDFSGIKDNIGSFECVGNPFWEESANFITLAIKMKISAEEMKAAKEAEAMGIELSYNATKSRLENQPGSTYGNNKRKQPALSLVWLKKLHTMHILFTSMTSSMPQWKTDIAGWAGCFGCKMNFIPVRTERDLIVCARRSQRWQTA